ncbi:hypothetical protein B0H10DRAFT_1966172 [Mycena sp. CBHHK59/15]|nr:hypothetical protein B0H10DRAFT_1966172 [Mycena sp. CBHHK59/15]
MSRLLLMAFELRSKDEEGLDPKWFAPMFNESRSTSEYAGTPCSTQGQASRVPFSGFFLREREWALCLSRLGTWRWRYQVRPEFMRVRGTLGSVAYVDSTAGMAWRRNGLRPLLIGKKIANSPPGLGRHFTATGVDSEFTPRSKAWTQNGLHLDSIRIHVHVTVRGNLF